MNPVRTWMKGSAPETRGAIAVCDRPAQAGNRLQLCLGGGRDGCRLEPDFLPQRHERAATLHVRHQVRDLLPENQLEGIPADRRRRLAVVAAQRGEYGREREHVSEPSGRVDQSSNS